MGLEHWWNVIDKENVSIRREICPSDTFSTTNPTWTDLKSMWVRVIYITNCFKKKKRSRIHNHVTRSEVNP